jgi:hypothetical protein
VTDRAFPTEGGEPTIEAAVPAVRLSGLCADLTVLGGRWIAHRILEDLRAWTGTGVAGPEGAAQAGPPWGCWRGGRRGGVGSGAVERRDTNGPGRGGRGQRCPRAERARTR